ncbi:MAG: Crp/Fnr family transcriptional regulator [Bacteroidota bacterium]
MPNEKANLITEHLKDATFSKQEIFLREGQISRYSYFLETGFIRCFTVDLEGNEVTTRIFSAPDFINDYLSFFKRQASKENYEAITDCVVKTLDFDSAQYCFHNIPEFREWGRMMLTMNYVTLHSHMLAMHKETAEERYANLLAQSPSVIQNVPLKIIASYLGITDTSLSRIRRNFRKSADL